MILVTVGTQLPFDRLIGAVERWGHDSGCTDIVFQIGRTERQPTLGKVMEFIPAAELEGLLEQAEVVIGHAGIGTIISRLSLRKPVVIMPRLYALGEHRNDHQKATVARLRHLQGVFVANSEADLPTAIEHARQAASGKICIQFPEHAATSLTDYIRVEVL